MVILRIMKKKMFKPGLKISTEELIEMEIGHTVILIHNTFYIIYFPDIKLISVIDLVLLVSFGKSCVRYMRRPFVLLNIQCPPPPILGGL